MKKKNGPTTQRHRSNQTHATPVEFVSAIEKRFDLIDLDLAAVKSNSVVGEFISPRENSLKQDWTKLLKGRMGYLNPPFDPVAPWIAKAVEEAANGARFVILLRASIDANWFWQMEESSRAVYALKPRIKFVGSKESYPSPLILSVFNVDPEPGGRFDYFDHGGTKLARWHWKEDVE
jgi:phage N-6-adenine-methyltransferase